MDCFIFLEGYYDELFINRILVVQKIDYKVKLVQYAQEKDSKINNYLSVLISQNMPFLFLADEDGTNYSSNNLRINELKRRYPKLPEDKIVLVVPEIEGWYIAGLTKNNAMKLKLKNLPDPNVCTKELFISRLLAHSDGTLIRSAIMDSYNIEIAMKNSPSFRKFIEKIQLW